MVPAYVLYTLALQRAYALRVINQFFEFLIDAVVRGLYVNDGAQFFLAQYLIVFGLAAPYTDV